MTEHVATNETILVVGGGISGMTAALEAAETGKNVVLVEKNPALGGRTSQLYRYFPKLCHPTCGLEINLRRLKNNPRVRVLTLAEVTGLSGGTGNYTASIKIKPRYVNENCTACGDCERAVEMKVDDPFNYNLGQHKAAFLPNAMAYPQRYVLDPAIIGTADADKAKAACKYGAIDLDMQEETIQVKAGAVVWATGWQPYDAAKIQPYGYGRFKNVITSVEFERLADIHGPTGGKILRPSDGKEAKNIAFIQCAGSRDENHLAHCSYICCLASLKQASYVRELYGDSKAKIFYIDIRTPGLYENRFYTKLKADANVSFLKGKVAKIEAVENGDVKVTAEDIHGGGKITETFDMVVLATGMEPTARSLTGAGVPVTDDGFVDQATLPKGIYATGTLKTPVDVARSAQDATGVVMKSIQSLRRN